MNRPVLRWVQLTLLVFGLACIGYVVAAAVEMRHYQASQNRVLDEAIAAHAEAAPAQANQARLPNPDAAAKSVRAGHLIGRIEVPRLKLSAILRHGDDEATLKVAVGHLPGTPLPGQTGNSVFAAHRDTLFRPLRNIKDGDDITITTTDRIFTYRVTKTHIVDPKDVWVMNSTTSNIVTLITCYPFDFIGNAPRRFIVHATQVASRDPALTISGTPSKKGP